MSLRRDVLRAIYPAYRWMMSFTEKGAIHTNEKTASPGESFYALAVQLNDGTTLHFDGLKGKKVLIINTASDCVYTDQYAELEPLAKETNDRLAIIAFPSNDFKEQEKGTDKEIAAFCGSRYHISFPIASKSHVVGKEQNRVFRWLTDSQQNGWNNQAPVWNFSKYLVDERGLLTHYFGPAVPPAHIKKLAFRAG
ncbi:glutathione peroxidase [Polluticoccus soli]|uniref:glutathione peroxidase n=1 Tax=Polluticoccus soli TaxID=3034150 RepID=UPI0023E34A47|nr:glutathione peroxidase [Flavipsychrobacter sp. JY13-12]